MNLPEMPRWVVGNVGDKIGYAAAEVTTRIIDGLVPMVMTAAMNIRDAAADKAKSVTEQAKDIPLAVSDRIAASMTQEQFNRVWNPMAVVCGLAIVVKEKMDLRPRINERRTK